MNKLTFIDSSFHCKHTTIIEASKISALSFDVEETVAGCICICAWVTRCPRRLTPRFSYEILIVAHIRYPTNVSRVSRAFPRGWPRLQLARRKRAAATSRRSADVSVTDCQVASSRVCYAISRIDRTLSIPYV